MLAYIVFRQNFDNAEAFASLLNALDAFSPTIEIVKVGEVLLDLGVMTDRRKVKSEARRLHAAISKTGTVGLAEGRFVAFVAAHVTKDVSVVFPGDEAAFLASKPLSFLPIESETLRRLDLLGFSKIGDLLKVPEEDLVSLFGTEGCLMGDLMKGQDSKLVVGKKLEENLSASFTFDFPVENIIGEIDQALEGLCVSLREKQLMATRVKIAVSCPQTVSVTLNLASPSDNSQRIAKPLRDRFAALTLPGPISGFELSLEGFVVAHARQLTLESLLPKANRLRSIERILQRLAVRTDSSMLMRVVWDDARSRIPERRGHLQDILRSNLCRGLYIPKPINVAADTAGAPYLVRQHRYWHPVETIMEAWEIKDEWWTPRPIARSYFRVKLQNGSILRLFRDQKRGSWFHQNR
jgi:nucleotidyltransferase/DNA polymerase involved in DNA repair